VIDFLDFDFFDISIGGWSIHRWWAFNIADAAITCAIIFLIIRMLWPIGEGDEQAERATGSGNIGTTGSDSTKSG
jgi:lipoprotein signal peptidase